MFKKRIQTQLKKTGTFRVIEKENKRLTEEKKNLEEQLQIMSTNQTNLNKKIDDLVKQVQRFQKDVPISLINNLKAENKSLKEHYLKTDIPFSQGSYNKLTIIILY